MASVKQESQATEGLQGQEGAVRCFGLMWAIERKGGLSGGGRKRRVLEGDDDRDGNEAKGREGDREA